MEESFLEILSKVGSFTEKEALFLKNELQFHKLEKDEFLLQKGEICSSLCFVISGCFYQYGVDSENEINIIDLNISNDWVINYKSFSSRKPSEYSIQAFEGSSVYMLSIDSIHKLIGYSQSFLQMGRVLQETTSRIDFFDNNSTPDQKYQFILKNKPGLLQKFPQRIVAAYLKITPETLSRVRKRSLKV